MKRKRVMQSVEHEKYEVEKRKLLYCQCGHTNTLHGGWVWTCYFIGCTCQEFKERIESTEPPRSAFRKVAEIMGK